MWVISLSIFSLMLMQKCYCSYEDYDGYSIKKLPTVGISVLVRNKEDHLPYFLSSIYNLDYPKERMYLWFYIDYSEDNSANIIQEWLNIFGHEYYEVHFIKKDTPVLHEDQTFLAEWTPKRYEHVMKLREEALNFARKRWVNYLFMIDADVILTNRETLNSLISKELDVVAPMLTSDGLYSNFWCAMNETTYYFVQTEEYEPILKRDIVGCMKVPMIHTAVLINLTKKTSDYLTYNSSKLVNYNGPNDDIVVFAVNAERSVPLESTQSITDDTYQLAKLKFAAISQGHIFPIQEYFEQNLIVSYPKKTKLGCNEIFMINLNARTERRLIMEEAFKQLGIDATLFKAVDGKSLSDDYKKFFLNPMPNYEDPYHKRPMKSGEVGCFLSHYLIWKEVVDRGLQITLILEDDLRFTPSFRERFFILMKELSHLEWDLCYIGRKILSEEEEVKVTKHIVKPKYSYWTLGYLISEQGARKLLQADPLSNILPVDEFLPIMYDQHPNITWKSHFPVRNLNAYSASPLLVHPTHYTGDKGYVSDTEGSEVIIQWPKRPARYDL